MNMTDLRDSLHRYGTVKRRQLVFLQTKYFSEFSFIHINKTGGSSIERALGVPLIHETAQVFRNRIGVQRWEERFSFAIVRNPWDRAVSHYHYRMMTNQTNLVDNQLDFKDWLKHVYVERSPKYLNEEKMFLTQMDWILDENGKVMVNYIGRFEDMQRAWDEICENLNRKQTKLPHVKKSLRGDFRQYYDNESCAIIGDYFKSDVDYFKYSF